MSRITESHVYAAFIRLCNHLEKPCYIPPDLMRRFNKGNPYFPKPDQACYLYFTIGSWSLSNYYNRWRIEEMDTEGGGISHPLSNDSKPSREFVESLRFALTCLYFAEKERARKAKPE